MHTRMDVFSQSGVTHSRDGHSPRTHRPSIHTHTSRPVSEMWCPSCLSHLVPSCLSTPLPLLQHELRRLAVEHYGCDLSQHWSRHGGGAGEALLEGRISRHTRCWRLGRQHLHRHSSILRVVDSDVDECDEGVVEWRQQQELELEWCVVNGPRRDSRGALNRLVDRLIEQTHQHAATGIAVYVFLGEIHVGIVGQQDGAHQQGGK
mmetsp:Transcript_20075/g.48722  ORF Transcript_20075/g.48722 Transcript_20075/m.48722 type:complete len:205 (-) Transcript_20075:756-1370(-)